MEMLRQMKIAELMNDRTRQSSEQAIYDVLGSNRTTIIWKPRRS